MDAKVARRLKVRVVLDSSCIPLELLTFGKTIKPIGRATIECSFPGETNTRTRYPFFVFQNFAWPVIMGHSFLRETKTFDCFPRQLSERPLEVHDTPIVAFLPGEEETLKFWLDGEELPSTPDTGSEINVMSYDFAIKRFQFEPDAITQVRFADGSLQEVEGKVSVPVSFGNGAPTSLLLKLVDLKFRSEAPAQAPAPDGAISYGTTASILADFHVLKGLKVDIILGEDLLSTVNAFVRHSTDFDELRTPNSLYPGLATIITVKELASQFSSCSGRVTQESLMYMRRGMMPIQDFWMSVGRKKSVSKILQSPIDIEQSGGLEGRGESTKEVGSRYWHSYVKVSGFMDTVSLVWLFGAFYSIMKALHNHSLG